MKLQVLQDSSGRQTGVFLPIEDWNLIVRDYPEIEDLLPELPKWEQDLMDKRIETITNNPERIIDGGFLLSQLKK